MSFPLQNPKARFLMLPHVSEDGLTRTSNLYTNCKPTCTAFVWIIFLDPTMGVSWGRGARLWFHLTWNKMKKKTKVILILLLQTFIWEERIPDKNNFILVLIFDLYLYFYINHLYRITFKLSNLPVRQSQ